jgi:hypothetical protein
MHVCGAMEKGHYGVHNASLSWLISLQPYWFHISEKPRLTEAASFSSFYAVGH